MNYYINTDNGVWENLPEMRTTTETINATLYDEDDNEHNVIIILAVNDYTVAIINHHDLDKYHQDEVSNSIRKFYKTQEITKY